MMEDEEENDIMNRLDYLKLETIYNDYDILGGNEGLELNEFIAVMTQEQHLGVKKESKEAHIQMVRNLIDLFRQIDVNNDKTLEWVEFTNHIIELGMVRPDKVFIDSIKNYHPSDIKDSKHDTEIDNIFYLPKLQHLLVMERDAKKFKVYDTKTGKYMQTVPEKATDNGVIIAADYIEKGNTKLVATTTNNLQICFWDSNNYIWRNRINCAEIQLCSKLPVLTVYSEVVRR